MDNQNAQPQINVDLTNTEPIKNSKGGNILLSGVILRKVSKFVAGTDNDAVLPLPVFYDPHTYKILEEGLPKELREELKAETFTL